MKELGFRKYNSGSRQCPENKALSKTFYKTQVKTIQKLVLVNIILVLSRTCLVDHARNYALVFVNLILGLCVKLR